MCLVSSDSALVQLRQDVAAQVPKISSGKPISLPIGYSLNYLNVRVTPFN